MFHLGRVDQIPVFRIKHWNSWTRAKYSWRGVAEASRLSPRQRTGGYSRDVHISCYVRWMTRNLLLLARFCIALVCNLIEREDFLCVWCECSEVWACPQTLLRTLSETFPAAEQQTPMQYCKTFPQIHSWKQLKCPGGGCITARL